MGLRSLLCVLFISLSFPISLSSRAPLHHGLSPRVGVDTKAYNTKHSYMDKDGGERRIHRYMKKGSHGGKGGGGGGGGGNSAGHHTPGANRKSPASSLSPPSSSIVLSLLPCIFIFFPLL